ncbi:alpha/beta hydrolase [Haloferacaceae archaeon DSL9]
MSARLSTPPIHRILESPIGRPLATRPIQRANRNAIPRTFAAARVRAAADAAETDVDAFVDAIGIDRDASPLFRRYAGRALDAQDGRRRAMERVTAHWEDAVWGDDVIDPDDLVALETRRRNLTTAWARPTRSLAPLVALGSVDPVDYDIPDPEPALDRLAADIDDPESVYEPPSALPVVDASAEFPGPDTVEYLVRFTSPTLHDIVHARVYEPAPPRRSRGALPTLVFGSGLGAMNDCLSYWPEEAAFGRRLAAEGYRAILPESPWSGRRERYDSYSGEPYLAGAPESMIELFVAQAQEFAVLTAWARERGAPGVAVGGVSLSGIVTMFLAGFCADWDAIWTPDAAVPVAMATRIDRLVRESALANQLGLTRALREAGWTARRLETLVPLLTPPATTGIDPARIYPVAGLDDEVAPYGDARETLDRWGVPPANRTEWESTHFGVYLRSIRTDAVRQRVRDALGETPPVSPPRRGVRSISTVSAERPD